jgi:hypothetical protein
VRARHDRAVGIALGVAVYLQGLGLVVMGRLSGRALLQTLLVAAALGVVATLAWRVRGQLDHRVDMALVMASFGGLGMLVGWWIDHLPAVPMAPHSPLYPTALDAALSWMTGLMLLGGVPPAVAWTRCAYLARRDRRRWITTHLIGNAAMVVGMIAAGRTFGAPLGGLVGSRVVGGHVAMLLGMVVGMEAGMWLGEAAAGLRPWVRIRVPVEKDRETREARRGASRSRPVMK